MSLFGVSRSSRNESVELVQTKSAATTERVQSGLLQMTGKSKKVRLRDPHGTFKLEASFESTGTIYPQIRKLFLVSMVVMSVVVLVRYFIVPQSLTDPDNPLPMTHHTYSAMLSHFLPAMVFLFGSFFQKESVQQVAKNPKYLVLHRWVGRVSVSASLIASIFAWRVTPHALYGTQLVYVPWNIFWNYASFQTFRTAWVGDFGRHRLWANVLVHTAFLFVTSRLFLVLGVIVGANMKLVYVVSVNGAAFLAFYWYLLESGQWARTVATRRRWAKLRAFVLTYGRIVHGRREKRALLNGADGALSPSRICPSCNTPVAPAVMRCENVRCHRFDDRAQGEYSQLLLDTSNWQTLMPLSTSIDRLCAAVDGNDLSQLRIVVMTPFLVIYVWMALPLTNSLGGVSFHALLAWHLIYVIICVHMAAAIYKCFPIRWSSVAKPDLHYSSPFWNTLALIAAGIDAIFLSLCRANDLWIDQNTTWILGLVVAFVPVLAAPFLFSDKRTPRRFVRALYANSAICLPLMGYLGATFSASFYVQTGSQSIQWTLGIMVALQLYEEVLSQVSKGVIDAAKKEFGLDDTQLPPSQRTKEQQCEVDNLELLFVFQDFMFGAYFFCFYRELWTNIDSTLVCVQTQAVLLLQDFNMILGGSVLRSVRVVVEGPVRPLSEQDPRDSAAVLKDRRPAGTTGEYCVRLPKGELTETFRALSFKLLVRLITMAATPFFGLMCRYGPNAVAFPSWSSMSNAQFVTVVKNFSLMLVLESFFVVFLMSSVYKYFRINLLQLLTSTVLQSRLSRVLVVCSCIHLLQDFYVAIIDLPPAM